MPQLNSKPVVLILDTDKALVRWLDKVSSIEGLRFELIQTAQEAIRNVQESNVALLLVNLALTGLDGQQVYTLIRSHEHTRCLPDVPVLALTDRCTQKERARTLSAGFFEHFTKPLKVDRIEEAFRQTTEMRNYLHRNQHSVDRDSIIEQLAKALFSNKAEAGPAISGITLTLETFCSDLLYRVLVAKYGKQNGEIVAHATRLESLASDIGAQHLATLCSSIAVNPRASEKLIEWTVVQAKAELDRMVFSLREEAFSRGALDKRMKTCKS